MNFFGFDMLPFQLDKLPSAHDGQGMSSNNMYTTKSFGPAYFKMPIYEWQVAIGELVIKVEKGRAPSWFNRFMQNIFLGFKWSKIARL